MRILGQIHTFNDEDIVRTSYRALAGQTRPPDEIIIVDNDSKDGTIDRLRDAPATIIRHPENRGTSGAVVTGLQYALQHGFDWIYILDADSAPEADAIEQLLTCFAEKSPAEQERTWLLGSFVSDRRTGAPHHGGIFTSRGLIRLTPAEDATPYPCDTTIWSGSFYRMAAVKSLGLPQSDYFLDWGEVEYNYRGKKAGYLTYICRTSRVAHNLRGEPSLHYKAYRLGPFSLRLREFRPMRCYYACRNIIHFTLYEYEERTLYTLYTSFRKIAMLCLDFLIRLPTHHRELRACLAGIVDGLRRRMHKRYVE